MADTKTPEALGFSQAREITRHWAKTFYFASRFLPRDTRRAAYAVYAVCRLSDDSVDSGDPSAKMARLRGMEDDIAAAYAGTPLSGPRAPLLLAFRRVAEERRIPKEHFDALLRGMRMDLEQDRYRDFQELYGYCWHVAGVVGLIMLKVFGEAREDARPYAEKLGVAMQLTNILRDIREDLAAGRIYLPQDEMARFSVSEGQLAQGLVDAHFRELMRFQVSRAREYYRESGRGIPMISGPACRFVVKCMKGLYAGILDEIEKDGYQVFQRRHAVPFWRKCGLLAITATGGNTP